jgi:hypothetical protein
MRSQTRSSNRDGGSFKLSFSHVLVVVIVFSFALPVIFVLFATRSSRVVTTKVDSTPHLIDSSLSLARDVVSQSHLGINLPFVPQYKRYAFAITITKDGFFQDGAAVLAYSIVRMFTGSTNAKFSFIAFVHPSVINSRIVLKRLGFHVIVAPTPVNVSAIAGPTLRDKIDKNGCCGASELIKLNSYRYFQPAIYRLCLK